MINLKNMLRASVSALLAGTALAAVMLSSAQAAPITKQLVVTVVQVCNSDHTSCASTGPAGDKYFEAEADKIWAQAGIDIKFVDGGFLDDTSKNSGQTGVGGLTGSLAGPGTTMYLVNHLVCPSCTLYGEAYLDAGGLVIDMSAVLAFSAAGRLDTIAHELGHNLGIDHVNDDGHYLMHQGDGRFIPSSLGEICPDGPCYDLLPADQIANAYDSALLVAFTPASGVPEPTSLALTGLALLAIAARRRRV